ncbi:MFS transporter [Methanobacterium aggregans]|uniref:MFS transporter n=1 Tax=Methanobacterium aggregans TaxID=1615586 RepID=UPI001AE38A6E|nr:MFS transporter [Methanobacterium aggregans]MBP2045110.1 MFS family permease [Methanobacterium aggregans]
MTDLMLNQYKKTTRTHYKILGLSWAGWIFDFYDLILFTFLIIPIGTELHLSNLMLSYALGISLAATAIGGVIFGFLSDRYGRRTVLQITIIVYSVGTFLCGLSTSLESLILFRIITGLGVGGEWATGQTYIGETFPPHLRGRYGSFMQTGAPLGIAFASVVGGLLAPSLGWRTCFFLSIIPAFMVIYIRRGLPESDLWLKEKEERAKRIFKGTKDGLKDKKKELNKFLVLFSREYRKEFLLALLLAVLGLSAYWFTYSWMPDYLYSQRHFSLTKSALWIIVTQIGGFLGYLSFGFVADKIGRRPAYSIYCFTMALGLVMITVLWDVVVVYPPVILTFMFLVGFGTGFFGGYGPLFSELFPTAIRNTASGSAFNLGRGAQFLTPIIIASIATKYDLSLGIFLAAVFAVATGLWIWTFPETMGRNLEELEED